MTAHALSDSGLTYELGRAGMFDDADRLHALGQRRCAGMAAPLENQDGSWTYWTRLPRGCVKIDGTWPGKVRVGVKTESYGSGVYDRAPGRKRFGPWLARS